MQNTHLRKFAAGDIVRIADNEGVSVSVGEYARVVEYLEGGSFDEKPFVMEVEWINPFVEASGYGIFEHRFVIAPHCEATFALVHLDDNGDPSRVAEHSAFFEIEEAMLRAGEIAMEEPGSRVAVFSRVNVHESSIVVRKVA